jgi:hypothetical protein
LPYAAVVARLDKEIEDRIAEPASEEAEREARLSPADAVAQMRLNVPARRNVKLREVLARANDDVRLKAWWHVANVNAVKRLGINDHSWVHVQIVANIALRLLRGLTKRGVEPAMVADYDLTADDAEVVVVLGALLFAGAMADGGHSSAIGLIAGPVCAALGWLAVGGLVERARRRLEGGPAALLTAYADGAAVILAAVAIFLPPLSYLALVGFVLLLAGGRRREGEKYAGLRVLR